MYVIGACPTNFYMSTISKASLVCSSLSDTHKICAWYHIKIQGLICDNSTQVAQVLGQTFLQLLQLQMSLQRGQPHPAIVFTCTSRATKLCWPILIDLQAHTLESRPRQAWQEARGQVVDRVSSCLLKCLPWQPLRHSGLAGMQGTTTGCTCCIWP